MNKEKGAYLIDIISLLFFTVLTILAIGMQEITIFYVIYLFWWDEVMKTVFDFLRYIFKKNQIADTASYKVEIGARVFMLFIYFVFIIVCFGLVINWENLDVLYKNFSVMLFQNIYFNISLISFFGREAFVFNNKKLAADTEPHNIMSGRIIILHVSIIIGLLFWAVASNRLVSLPFSIEQYSAVLAIVPFLIIKFLFEWFEIRSKHKLLNKANEG